LERNLGKSSSDICGVVNIDEKNRDSIVVSEKK